MIFGKFAKVCRIYRRYCEIRRPKAVRMVYNTLQITLGNSHLSFLTSFRATIFRIRKSIKDPKNYPISKSIKFQKFGLLIKGSRIGSIHPNVVVFPGKNSGEKSDQNFVQRALHVKSAGKKVMSLVNTKSS